MKQIIIFLIIVMTSTFNSASAQKLDLEKIIPLAEKGIATQQYNLGYSYFHGEGVDQDKEKGMYWLNKAAKGDSAAVHYKIGRLYETGEIYPQDNKKAFEYYLLSAQSGDPYGTVNLSVMYLEGKGVKQNIDEGIAWAEKAAKRGFVNAQINLALLYDDKALAIYDRKKAIFWFSEAASQGSVLARYEIGKDHLINKRYEKAFEYFDLAVEGGNTDAMILLAMMFEQGLATERNSEASLKLLQLAYEQGNLKAARYLKAYRSNTIKNANN
ncbi:SEL1-like repeat protein [Paraglaciecola arctica]|uniref:SEL1-like repeat protein n=1 Tax=Paraglaciecola arctica TaxID=1128911 RepID=UPI001C077963|nr:tetratricopeptide repeat protein [Paraglaciecola arctica]MBU3004177.1 sel1 repeat family protein [Paraglaciecola arctica]